eukprot:TRINITY_DN40809_c0_g1_i1.p1 TRINITY_DN40809_c0_g1~~TRINITY_DN40809_c0_g1_i1.p1  ORF type:complete len:317 (+),score=69.96 TRINITY_DN40809_c0_g1_i1:136-951(+)
MAVQRPPHAERTAAEPREADLHICRVTDVAQLTPSVRRLRLAAEQPVCHKAGQWVDFHAPGVPVVGGYSITSPATPSGSVEVELAVKCSDHPPAAWVHHLPCGPRDVGIGEAVSIRVGGACAYDPAGDGARPLLLVAGGIGITPLASIFLTRAREQGPRCCLLYSVREAAELALLDELSEAAAGAPQRLRLEVHFTRQPEGPWALPEGVAECRRSRISPAAAAAAAEWLAEQGSGPLLCFVCGPPQMSEALCPELRKICPGPDGVRCESWW